MKRHLLSLFIALALLLVPPFNAHAVEGGGSWNAGGIVASDAAPEEEASVTSPDGTEAPVLPAEESEFAPPSWLLPPETQPVQSPDAALAPLEERAPQTDAPLLPTTDVTVDVLVPSVGNIIINPYQIEVTIDGRQSVEQIASGVYAVENRSEVPVAVSASAIGTAPWPSEVVFSAAPPAENAPLKEVFLFVEFQNADFGGQWNGTYAGAPNQLPVTVDAAVQQNVMNLDALETGWFRMFGSAAVCPELEWSASDIVEIQIVFSFTALVASEPVNPAESWGPVAPINPGEPENPAEPVAPVEPEGPAEPVTPSEPEDPAESVTPSEPEGPAESVTPSEPEAPAEPVTPSEPEAPAEPVTPSEPEAPAEPVTPSEPEAPAEPVTPSEPEDPAEPVTLVESENSVNFVEPGTLAVFAASTEEITFPYVVVNDEGSIP